MVFVPANALVKELQAEIVRVYTSLYPKIATPAIRGIRHRVKGDVLPEYIVGRCFADSDDVIVAIDEYVSLQCYLNFKHLWSECYYTAFTAFYNLLPCDELIRRKRGMKRSHNKNGANSDSDAKRPRLMLLGMSSVQWKILANLRLLLCMLLMFYYFL